MSKKRKGKATGKELEIQATQTVGAEIDKAKDISEYDADALNLHQGWYAGSKQTHEDMAGDWTTWNQNFRSHLVVDSNYNFVSQVFVPTTEKIIRALLAKYIVAIFLRKPFFDVIPREPMDDKKVERIKKLLEYTFDKMPDFTTNIVRFVQMMLIYGTAIGKVYNRKIEKIVGKEKKTKVVYNGPYFEPIDIKNFYIDPSATKLNGFYKGHLSYKTLCDLKKSKIYKNVDKIQAVYNTPQNPDDTVAQDRRDIRELSTPVQMLKEYDVVELVEWWSPDDSRIIVVANGNTIVRDEANPFWHGEHPFVSATYEPLPFEFYGKGICEMIAPEQSMINTIMNEILDNVRLINNKMWVGVVGAVHANQIVSKRGKIIWTDDINALREVSFGPLPSDAYRLLDRLQRGCEEVTGTTSATTAVGAPVTKEQTALEVSTMSRLGNEIHALNILLLEIPAITEIVRKSYQIIVQNFSKELVIRITGGEEGWDGITEEDITGDFDIVPKVGMDVMSKEVVAQNLRELAGLLSKMPGYDVSKVIKIYVETLGYRLDDFKQEAEIASEGETAPQEEITEPVGMVGQVGTVAPSPELPEGEAV